MGIIYHDGQYYGGGSGGDSAIEITQAELDALSPAEKKDKTFFVTDGVVPELDIINDTVTSLSKTYSSSKITELLTGLVYKARDKMNLNQIMCSGCISSSATTILFTIPLPKPMVADSAEISDTKFSCRHFGGYVYIKDDTNLIQMYGMTQDTLENYCDITYYYNEGHVTVICKLKTGKFIDSTDTTVTNNIPITFHIVSGQLVFS